MLLCCKHVLTFDLDSSLPQCLREPLYHWHTEQEWWCYTTSAALERLNEMICRLIHKQGSFSPTGRFLGILPMLGYLLQEAGVSSVTYTPYVIDWSYGTQAWAGLVEDARVLFKISLPALVDAGISSREEVELLYSQMESDLLQPDFRGTMIIITASGKRQ